MKDQRVSLRDGEVLIHVWTLVCLARRAKLSPGQIAKNIPVAGTSVHGYFSSTDKHVVLKEATLHNIVAFIGRVLKEPIDPNVLVVVVDDRGLPSRDYRSSVKRQLVREGAANNPIASIAREPRIVQLLTRSEPASMQLYVGLINRLWRFRDTDRYWMCSMREASAYVSYLQGKTDSGGSFYGCEIRGRQSSLMAACMMSHFGWHEALVPYDEYAVEKMKPYFDQFGW